MRFLSFGVFLCVVWPCKATFTGSQFIGADGEEHGWHSPPKSVRSKLEHFLGLRHEPHAEPHQAHHPVVIHRVPVVHHGLHMLNHRVQRVGPLQHKALKPFGNVSSQELTLNSSVSSNESIAEPIGAYAIATTGDWNAINMKRAETCVSMLRKLQERFTDNKGKCVVFMEENCKTPGGEAICKEWLDLLNKKRNLPLAPPPSPAEAASPAAVPPGLDQSDSVGEKMDEGAALPEQGYSGALVAHDDMKTATSDWHKEYGPDHHSSYEEICKAYPNNMWCKYKGYPKKPEIKSGTSQLVIPTVLLALVAASC